MKNKEKLANIEKKLHKLADEEKRESIKRDLDTKKAGEVVK